MVSWDTLKIRDVCMDFEAYFKVHNLVSGSIMIFHVVVSVYQLVKIWNSPQFPDEFRNGQFLPHGNFKKLHKNAQKRSKTFKSRKQNVGSSGKNTAINMTFLLLYRLCQTHMVSW